MLQHGLWPFLNAQSKFVYFNVFRSLVTCLRCNRKVYDFEKYFTDSGADLAPVRL
jgi:hypothetical protein